MADGAPQEAGGLVDAAAVEQADLETLRLAYAEAEARMDLARDERRVIAAEYAALPPSAGAILALLTAFRPEQLPGVFPYLYALAVVPFVLILYMSIVGTHDLWSASTRAKIAGDLELSAALSPNDLLEVRLWLADRIVGWRIAADLHLKSAANYTLHISRIRIVFGVLVGYMVVLTSAALVAGP